MTRFPRGFARHVLTFAVMAAVTALPWFAAATLIWSQ